MKIYIGGVEDYKDGRGGGFRKAKGREGGGKGKAGFLRGLNTGRGVLFLSGLFWSGLSWMS